MTKKRTMMKPSEVIKINKRADLTQDDGTKPTTTVDFEVKSAELAAKEYPVLRLYVMDKNKKVHKERIFRPNSSNRKHFFAGVLVTTGDVIGIEVSAKVTKGGSVTIHASQPGMTVKPHTLEPDEKGLISHKFGYPIRVEG